MLARVLFQATENKPQLPFCTILTNTHTHTHPPTSPTVAPSRAVAEQVVSPKGCMLNPPGASGEIPLGQEPAHKDRKWNSST